VPALGTGTISDPRRPKSFDGLRFAGMDYGFQPLYLVAADLPGATDSAITANSDVFAFPVDLNPTLTSGQVNSARSALEAVFIPAQTLSPQDTWRGAARMVAGMFQFMQRLQNIWGNTVVLTDGAQLNVQFGSLPADLQAAVLTTAESLGYATDSITSTTQIRAILKSMADAWGTKPFQLNEFTF